MIGNDRDGKIQISDFAFFSPFNSHNSWKASFSALLNSRTFLKTFQVECAHQAGRFSKKISSNYGLLTKTLIKRGLREDYFYR